MSSLYFVICWFKSTYWDFLLCSPSKVSWKKFLPVSSILISYQIFFWCKASIHILMNLICISKYRSHLHFCSWNLFFPTNRWAEGFTLSGNISLHISWNLCLRCVTVVQYEYRFYITWNTDFLKFLISLILTTVKI